MKRIVLDVLKPHKPDLVELASKFSQVKGVEGINVSLEEIDRDTESVRLTIEGTNIDFKELQEVITKSGCVIHSIDEVAAGKKLVEKH